LRKHLSVALLSMVAFHSLVAFADQVVLKNGDRLSGNILNSDGKTLVMKTEFAGEVTIQWPAIDEIHSTQALHVEVKGAKPATGTVTASAGSFEVATASSGTVTVPKDAVLTMRNPDQEAAYEQAQHPRFTQGWNGGVDVGFALTAGNSKTKNLALAFTADRKTLNDRIALYANSVYANSGQPGGPSATTANAIQSGIRYERNLNQRLFAFVGGDFQTDALQGLNLRSVFGGGLGYHLIKSERTTLDLLAGANYTRENYVTLNRNLAALTLGEELTHKLGKATLLSQKLYFFPDLSDAGQYRSTFNFGTVTKINKWLGWQNAFGDIYVTNPPVGKKTNDLTFTTGLNVTFAH
jgi:putative salt-induced outer membrane protein